MVHDPSSGEAAALVARIRRDQALVPSPPTRLARIGGTLLLGIGTLLVALSGMFWLVLLNVSAGLLPSGAYYQTGIDSAVVGIPGLAAGVWGWRLTHVRRRPVPDDVSKVFD